MNKVQNSVYGMLLLIKRGKQCIYFASIFKVRYILECIQKNLKTLLSNQGRTQVP